MTRWIVTWLLLIMLLLLLLVLIHVVLTATAWTNAAVRAVLMTVLVVTRTARSLGVRIGHSGDDVMQWIGEGTLVCQCLLAPKLDPRTGRRLGVVAETRRGVVAVSEISARRRLNV